MHWYAELVVHFIGLRCSFCVVVFVCFRNKTALSLPIGERLGTVNS